MAAVRGHSVRAYVNVIHGCNERCTYCVVPATRGVEQSRTMESVLSECLGLAQTGYKEITLLGQNIDAYGRDMKPKRTFAELLTYLNANLPDKMRIRYVSWLKSVYLLLVVFAFGSLVHRTAEPQFILLSSDSILFGSCTSLR